MEGEKERTLERRNLLEKMVREGFPDKSVFVFAEEVARKEYPWWDPKWRIRIEEPDEGRRRIVLFPTPDILTEDEVPFAQIFQEAISFADQKLKDSRSGLLGDLRITARGIEFKPRK